MMSPMYLIMNSGTHNLPSHDSWWHSDESPYVTVSETVTMTIWAPIKMFPKSKFMTKMQSGVLRTSLLHNKVSNTRRFEATAKRPNVHKASFTPVFSPIMPGKHVLFAIELEAIQTSLTFLCLFSQVARTHACFGKGERFSRSSLISMASAHTG